MIQSGGLYNILAEFGITVKLVRLVKMCLNESYSKSVEIGTASSAYEQYAVTSVHLHEEIYILPVQFTVHIFSFPY